MSDKKPNLDSLFEAVIGMESPEERRAFLDQHCGGDEVFRAQLEQLLASDEQAGSFLEKPAAELKSTITPEDSGEQRAASLDAGLTSAFGLEQAVVLGSSDHSVLRSIGATINIPRVSLREAEGDVETPIERPTSAEIPANQPNQRYQLQGEIARGGMGAILKGRDTDLGRDLAIKVLLDEHKDRPEVIQRFIEEAQIGGQLQHPGIAPVYELGQFADQRPFFSMKLVKGQTLSKLLADRKDSSDDRSRFVGTFEQVCQTLSYAHARGVIHRDLKPSNIMVGAFGEVQVMDWGLAKVLPSGGVADEKQVLSKHKDVSVIETRRSVGSDAPGSAGSAGSDTKMGSVMGTPAYMPPEQALGEIDQLDQRADVFGLGAILCEILTGLPPYIGEDSNAIFRMASRGRLDGANTRLDSCGADHELIRLAKDCLAPDRVDRPLNAGSVARRVNHYLESVETKLRSAEKERAVDAARVIEQRKRLLVTSYLAAVVFAVLTAGIVGTAWFAHEARNNFVLAEARAEEEKAQRIRAIEAEQLARQRLKTEIAATQQVEAAVEVSRKSLFDLNTAFGLAANEAHKPAESLLWFAEAARHAEAESNEARASLIRHASWSDSTPRLLNFIEPVGQLINRLNYSPQGNFLAALTESGQSTVWDIRSQARPVFSADEIVDQLWHPKRPWLVTATKGSVRIMQIPSGDVLHETKVDDPISTIACSPDGNRIAVGCNSIQLWDFAADSIVTISKQEEAKVFSISFSQDGTKVLAYYDDDFARVFSTQSDSQPPLLPPNRHYGTGFPGQPILSPSFVDQGNGILTKPNGTDVLWSEIGGEQQQKTISFGGVNITSITPSPDNRHFLLTNQGGAFQIWNAKDVQEVERGQIGSEVRRTEITPDGLDFLVLTANAVHRRRIIDGQPYGSSIEHPTELLQLTPSPNGRQVALADREGGIAIWDWVTYLPQHLHHSLPASTAVLDGGIRLRDIFGSGSRIKQSRTGKYYLRCGGNTIFGTLRRVTLHASEDTAIVDALESDSLVLDAAIAPDEETLALANLDHQVFVWQRGKPKTRRLLTVVNEEPLRITFGESAKNLIVLHIDGTISCFDTSTGESLWQVRHPEVEVISHRRQTNMHMYRYSNGFPIMDFQTYGLQISPDGSFCVTSCESESACVWNTRDGSLKIPPIRMPGDKILRIEISPDGQWLAIAGESAAEVWDIDGGTLRQRISITAKAHGLAFDASGERLAISLANDECTIWDWQNNKQVCPPIRGTHAVFPDPEATWLWTDKGLGENQTSEATLWNVATGNPLTPSWPVGLRGASVYTYFGDRQNCYFDHERIIHSRPIDQLLDPPQTTIEHRTQEAEILSAKRIDSGRVIRLTESEWMTRIKAMRESNPEFFTSPWQNGAMKTWHQHQRLRALNAANLYAARWHTNALQDALGERYKDLLAHETELNVFSALEHAKSGDIDKAAAHVRQISVNHADRFALHFWVVSLESLLHKDVVNLIKQLHSSGYEDETMRLFDFTQRVFAVRFARGQRLVPLGISLARDYWQRDRRPRAIAYYERSRPHEFVLGYHLEMSLILLASAQPQSAEVLVRELLETIDPEEADLQTLSSISLIAMAFPSLEAALGEQVKDFVERIQSAEPQHDTTSLLVALAELRTGQVDAAIELLRRITRDENASPPLEAAAYCGIAVAMLQRGKLEEGGVAIDKAKAAKLSRSEDDSPNFLYMLFTDALLQEAKDLKEQLEVSDE